MSRSIINFRPKGDPDAAPYSPQRDIANIYTPMLREVFAGLDEVNWKDYFKGWLEATNVTEGDLGKGVACFVEAHRLFIRDREVNTPYEAFEKAGFWELPNPVRILIFERIGEVVMGGFFVALRDVSYQGRSSAVHTDFMDMLAAGRALAAVLSDHRPREATSVDELLERSERSLVELEEFKRIYEQRVQEHENLKRIRAAADAECEILRASNEEISQDCYHAEIERDAFKARAEMAEVSHNWVCSLSTSMLVRVVPCLRLLWSGKLPK